MTAWLCCGLFVIYPTTYHNQNSFQHLLQTKLHIEYYNMRQIDIFNICATICIYE